MRTRSEMIRRRKDYQKRYALRCSSRIVSQVLFMVACVIKTRIDLAERFYNKAIQKKDRDERLVNFAALEELKRLNDTLNFYIKDFPEVDSKKANDFIKRGGK